MSPVARISTLSPLATPSSFCGVPCCSFGILDDMKIIPNSSKRVGEICLSVVLRSDQMFKIPL